MEHDVILECLEIADAHGVTVTAYAGDRILAKELDEQTGCGGRYNCSIYADGCSLQTVAADMP
jgi:hypothetical protein